jgi:hypothetical protein
MRSLNSAPHERKRVPTAHALLLLGLLLGAAPVAAAPPDDRPAPIGPFIGDLPDLYRMAAQSELAVLGEVTGLTRYAEFKVVERFTGKYEEPNLSIQFRGQSWEQRLDGQERIEFRPGDRYLLFLKRYREHGKVVDARIFELAEVNWGRQRLDAEAESSYVEAMRLLLGALTREEPRERWSVLGGLVGSRNVLAAAAALHEIGEAGIAGEGAIPVVLEQMDRHIASLTLAGLELLRRLGPTLPPTFSRTSLAEAVHLRIGWSGTDPVPVRRLALRCLLALGSPAIPWIEKIAKEDADQTIRYEAAVAALEARSSGKKPR